MYSIGCEYLVEEAIADNSIPSETAAEAEAHAQSCAGAASGASENRKISVAPADAPESLKDFLTQFYAWYNDAAGSREFDCAKAADGSSNILYEIVGNGSCVRFSQYPGAYAENHWDRNDRDPRGWGRDGYLTSYSEHSGQTVDWVAKNIFNVSDADIETLKKQGEENGQFYIETAEDGSYTYYNIIGGVGDPFLDIAFGEILFDGSRYTVSYDIMFQEYSRYGNVSYKYTGTCVAVMEYKNLDGRYYWSMYSNTQSEPVPMQTEEPSAAPDLFAQMPEDYIFTSGVGGWGTVIKLNDDGTFTGSYSDHDYGDSGDGYDATMYVSEFSGRFTDPVKINAYTYSFRLADLQYQTGPAGETKIVTDDYGIRIREISSLAYGIDGGETFYFYTKGAPVCRLSEEFLQWMYMPMPSARTTHYLPYPGLYNEAQKCGFYTFTE